MAARSRKNAKTTKKASSKDNNRRTAGSKGRSAKGAAQETAAKQQPGGDHRIRDEIIAIIVIAVGIFLVIALQTSAAGEPVSYTHLGYSIPGFCGKHDLTPYPAYDAGLGKETQQLH